ncbi:MAG: hypothetical protein H6650_11995 [Ardenticatenales bacterium]|nr:hypothetical protein [Ardenticatenales bacterium]
MGYWTCEVAPAATSRQRPAATADRRLWHYYDSLNRLRHKPASARYLPANPAPPAASPNTCPTECDTAASGLGKPVTPSALGTEAGRYETFQLYDQRGPPHQPRARLTATRLHLTVTVYDNWLPPDRHDGRLITGRPADQ